MGHMQTECVPPAPAYTQCAGLNVGKFEKPIFISGFSNLNFLKISLTFPIISRFWYTDFWPLILTDFVSFWHGFTKLTSSDSYNCLTLSFFEAKIFLNKTIVNYRNIVDILVFHINGLLAYLYLDWAPTKFLFVKSIA